jgi:hypothetical protein
VFPSKFIHTNNISRYNRADTADFNNTSASVPTALFAVIANNTSIYNGWTDEDPTTHTPTADGSGIGTFINVSEFTVANNQSFECSRSGLFFDSCSKFTATGNTIQKTNTGTTGAAVYLEDCSEYTVGDNQVDYPTGEALKLFNTNLLGRIVGNRLNGTISFPTPGGGVAYNQMLFEGNAVQTSAAIQVPFNFSKNRYIFTLGSSCLSVVSDYVHLTGEDVFSVTAGSIGVNINSKDGCAVRDSLVRTQSQAILIQGDSKSANVTSNYLESASGATLQVSGTCDRAMLQSNVVNNTGAANSINVGASCTLTSKVGNTIIAGTTTYSGTYEINY